jgi:hypothetical protein
MLTYKVTTERNGNDDAHEVDCHYFQDDVNFVYFKNGANKTVLAVPTDDVVSIELVQQHDGAGQTEPKTGERLTYTSSSVSEDDIRSMGQTERRPR